jgi:hypothetical protein
LQGVERKGWGKKQETANISSTDPYKTNMVSAQEENCYGTMFILKCLLLWKKKVLPNSTELAKRWQFC